MAALRITTILFLSTLLFSCVNNMQHDWGDYSNELYTYYKNPTEKERVELTEELLGILERTETNGIKPPPGIYAEYGTFLFQAGNYSGAIDYYTKEKNAWPDSAYFMDLLINALSKQVNKTKSESI